tara:strand:- start:48007 stop:49053 length:1047 start_codon:yes stop_codon:yes gene_type:complete
MRKTVNIIGNSAALASTLEQVSRLAPVNRPLLVLGERGTGKELVAERLHFLSPRWDAPLVKVNCAAMAESLLESELFGHEPGAFTGATRIHHGRFERADGGTLFLDELGNMSQRLQEKLLRLVEYGEFERLGGQQTLQVDVRVLAATHADLRQLADAGEFRHDLLDRLSFDVIHVPALRHRTEDIPELANHFAIGMCTELGWELFEGFSEKAMAQLLAYTWPGNIRELKNAVERSLHRWGDPDTQVDEIVIDPFISEYDRPMDHPDKGAITNADSHAPPPSANNEPTPTITDFTAHMNALEKAALIKALAMHQHNQKKTAKALKLSYDQLRGLIRKHGLATRRRRGTP